MLCDVQGIVFIIICLYKYIDLFRLINLCMLSKYILKLLKMFLSVETD